MCRLSGNLEPSASWNSQDFSRPVQDLLDLFPITLSSSYPKLSLASQLKSPGSITGHFLWSVCRGFYPWILVSDCQCHNTSFPYLYLIYELSALYNIQQLTASVNRNFPLGLSPLCVPYRRKSERCLGKFRAEDFPFFLK